MQTFAQKQNHFQPASSRLARFQTSAPALPRRAEPATHLQRAIGNLAGRRLLQAAGPEVAAASGTKEDHRGAPAFSPIPVHGHSQTGVQAKLAVSPPGDACEQEAERVSEREMRLP